MGQAKRRGTFEQRRQQVLEKKMTVESNGTVLTVPKPNRVVSIPRRRTPIALAVLAAAMAGSMHIIRPKEVTNDPVD